VVLAAGDTLRLDANFVDYAMVAIYFGFVMLIGFAAKRRVSTSIDFFLSGRSLGVFGVILVVVGLFFSPAEELAKSGGIRANLIAGIVMIVVAAVFVAWSLLRPVVVPVDPTPGEP